MLQFAAIALVVSGLLSAAAVASFSWSVATAKVLLPFATVVATLGILAVALAGEPSGARAWAFLFACAACGCCANAARNLFSRPTRWVHRFVIYAGYGATFAGMGAASLWLESRAMSGGLTVAVFIGVYALGSVSNARKEADRTRIVAPTITR
jgi:hypothetical protein